ncbi:hypothetical protein [Brevundimonas naejangsanensis]
MAALSFAPFVARAQRFCWCCRASFPASLMKAKHHQSGLTVFYCRDCAKTQQVQP